MSRESRGHAFRELHRRDTAFVIPNPWDVGTARLLEALGFEALATTSAGHAFSLGRPDGQVERDEMLAHVAEVAAASPLPVSADLESGYADDPSGVAETIRLAGAAGAVGGSIEDATGREDAPVHDLGTAVERVRAAAEAAQSLPFPFTLTARAENYLYGRTDLADTIARLQAYQEAGADVLYAPGLTRREDLESLLASVDRPVNVVMGLRGLRLDLATLSALGVRRVSVGSALARAALGEFLRAAREILDEGRFDFAERASGLAEITRLLERPGDEND